MSNKELASKIVNKAELTETDIAVDFNLISVIGYRREILFTDKIDSLEKASKELEKDILSQLESGTLVVGDNFVSERLS